MMRRLARPLLGLAFIDSGVSALRDDGRRAERARALGVADPQQVTRAVAAVQVGAGALLVLNRFPRLSALALAATVIPDAVTGHAFWTEQDKLTKRNERTLFTRDLGLLGGALVAVADTGGRESVPHRAGRTAKKTAKGAKKAVKNAPRP
jgi:putative oxidoreductase